MDENFLTLSQHARCWCSRPASRPTDRFVARDAHIYLDGGAYSDASALVTDKAGYRLPGPYRWTALRTRAFAVRTTTVPAGSFRGFGGTQANFASESQIDMIARRLGLDPLDVRLKNMLRPGETISRTRRADRQRFCAGAQHGRGMHRLRQAAAVAERGVGLAVGFKDGGGEARAARGGGQGDGARDA